MKTFAYQYGSPSKKSAKEPKVHVVRNRIGKYIFKAVYTGRIDCCGRVLFNCTNGVK